VRTLVNTFTRRPPPLDRTIAVRTAVARTKGTTCGTTVPIRLLRRWTIMDWRHRAACRDEDPELFFPIGNSGPALLQIEQAKAVCRRCPVASECLTWALDTGQDSGVWGGLSEDERRALKRRSVRLRPQTV
jgi:WhiB family redox-sensing transcriptional regulator